MRSEQTALAELSPRREPAPESPRSPTKDKLCLADIRKSYRMDEAPLEVVGGISFSVSDGETEGRGS